MKTLKLNFGQVDEILTREQLKQIVGGTGSSGPGASCINDDNCSGNTPYCIGGSCVNKYAKACENKSSGQVCQVDSKRGECRSGGTGPLVCFT